ncbi:MAG: F0F1 ATP synthase subunit gamma [Coriobacteriia bacterium]|nr:F0F1 ATP synthase subunit gamma [Coriobacteriia bacterium]
MQKLNELRQRMKTVSDIKTVTGTLATVSAAKLSRTRGRAETLHAYTKRLRAMLYEQQSYLAGSGRSLADVSPLLGRPRRARNRTLVVVTGDRGMCGGYNLAIERFALEFWDRSVRAGKQLDFVAMGRKGETYLRRRGAQIVHSKGWRREGVVADDVRGLLDVVLERYLSGATDEVYVIYTRFYSPVRRKPVLTRLLPMEIGERGRPAEESPPPGVAELELWSYEPMMAEVIFDLVVVCLLAEVHDMLLESYASEQGARMITMKEAAERAERTLRECRVAYNRLRREAITVDLLGSLFAAHVAEEQETIPTGAAVTQEEVSAHATE